MGSLITNGKHLYIKRSDEKWKRGVSLLIDKVEKIYYEKDVEILNFRDFNTADIELRDHFLGRGFIKVNLFEDNILELIEAHTVEDYLKDLPHKKRSYIKRQVLAHENKFELKIVKKHTQKDINHWYELYLNVAESNYNLNVLPLPKAFFKNIAKNKDWEILELKVKKEGVIEKLADSVVFNYINGEGAYIFSVIGMNYDYLKSHNIYKQTLYQVIKRAIEHKAKKVYLGLTTTDIKSKFNAETIPQCAYIQVKDHYKITLMNTISNE